MRLKVGVTVDAPPRDVWRELADLASHAEWMADAEEIRFVGSARGGVGTVLEVPTRIGPLRTTDRLVVTEWEPARSMGVEHEGAVSGVGRFTIRPRRRGRTRLTWSEELRFPWWLGGRLGEVGGKPVLRRIWRGNLRRLAARVEA